ncbi:MAG: shikimate kinase [Candidatus Tectomicrobia bacterium]|nr:shikimate kinase [Candidatus Tectomicrobia bacterium]
MKNIILTGLRGTGKTSLGKRLAAKLSRSFVDTDQLIALREGKTIEEIVKGEGWERFRELEHEVAKDVAQMKGAVISTGGGMLIFSRNQEILKPGGVVVLLVGDPVKLAKRISQQIANRDRPSLLQAGSLEEELKQLWEERKAGYYQVSDLIFEIDEETADPEHDLERKVERLMERLKSLLYSCSYLSP